MNKTHEKPQEPSGLRRRAVMVPGNEGIDVCDLSLEEVRQALEDLHTHQVELELQSEELRRTQEYLVASRDSYSALYDSAPVGYATVNGEGIIVEANLTLATMLGLERPALIRTPFSAIMVDEDQDTFYLYRRESPKTKQQHVCELRLRKDSDSLLWVRLEGIAVEGPDDSGDQLRLIVIDITERKEAQ